MRGDDQVRELLTDYYAAMEAKDAARFGAFYADGMTLTFANNPTVAGAANVVQMLSDMLGQVQSVHHDVINVWEQDGGVVVFEVVATWWLNGGAAIAIGACSICTIANGKFLDQRIYVDNSPLLAALG